MGMQGSTQELRRLIDQVQRISRGEHRRQFAASMGAEIKSLVREGFDSSRAPDGSSWKSLSSRAGKPLEKSGRLASSASWHLEVQDTSIGVSNPLPYAQMQQHGTGGLPGGKLVPVRAKVLAFKAGGRRVFAKSVVIPARPMVPAMGEIPGRWAQRLAAVAHKVLLLSVGR